MNLQQVTQWYDFSHKTIVITGGTGVLGGEMACALVGCGANVAVLDRNPNLPDALKKPLDAGPGKYMVVYGDVLVREDLEAAAKEVFAAFGDIDILINAAGGNHPDATTSSDASFLTCLMKRCALSLISISWARFCPARSLGASWLRKAGGSFSISLR